jgi:hypothetical protein
VRKFVKDDRVDSRHVYQVKRKEGVYNGGEAKRSRALSPDAKKKKGEPFLSLPMGLTVDRGGTRGQENLDAG